MGCLSIPARQHVAISGLVKDFIINLYRVSKLIHLSKKRKRKKKQLRPCSTQWSPGGCSELSGAYFSRPQLDWNNLLDVSTERQRIWMTDGGAPSALLPPAQQTLDFPAGKCSTPCPAPLGHGGMGGKASDPKGPSEQISSSLLESLLGYFWFVQRSAPFREQGVMRYSPGQTKT